MSPSQDIEIETLATESRRAKGVDSVCKSGEANLKETKPWAWASDLELPEKPLSA
jgi:hypothetical protein